MSARPLNEELNRLWHENHRRAVEKISKEIAAQGGNLTAVARTLDISVSTLIRWTRDDKTLKTSLKTSRVKAAREP